MINNIKFDDSFSPSEISEEDKEQINDLLNMLNIIFQKNKLKNIFISIGIILKKISFDGGIPSEQIIQFIDDSMHNFQVEDIEE